MEISIRHARPNDAQFVYETRFDKQSRKYSINSNKIKLSDHKKWFSKKVKSKKDKIYILFKKKDINKKISYVRFDKINFFYQVSIAISKKFRGKNLSYLILDQAEKKFNKTNVMLLALVNNKNSQSYKLFNKLNYFPVKKQGKISYFVKILGDRKKIDKYFKVINNIEQARKKNNVNWMDILRISFKSSPTKSAEIFKKITSTDKRINSLSKKINS